MTFSLAMDAADPNRLAEFWALALGYRREEPPAEFETWDEALTAWGVPEEQWDDFTVLVGDGPRIWFQKVPEPKTAKNRLHLDIHSGAGTPGEGKDWDVLRAKAAELVAAGAEVVEEFNMANLGEWIVMRDPEGNEFCVV